ncbi:hypothetical protein ACIGZJ_31070 [Kitasatospora sp. NPDC052868]|uniref:hypothetical protein n=1 Tax=Kitasatospora sp. NPDC052868 TaxID=3364060 RepID=UPI0037C6C021
MSAPAGRRLIAAGTIRHRHGRTTVLTVTEAGVTGRITTRTTAAADPDGEPAPVPDDAELPTAA